MTDLSEYYKINSNGSITTYVLDPRKNDVMTVGDLRKMLSGVPDNAEIIAGRGINDCDEYIQTVVVGKYLVGLFTELDKDIAGDEEDDA